MDYQDLNVEDKKKILGVGVSVVRPQRIKKIPIEFSGLKDDELLIKIECASLYDDDVSCWEDGNGLNYPLPMGMPGKDGIGLVVKAGKKSKIKKGEAVAVLHDKCLAEYIICNQKEVVKIPEKYSKEHIPIEAFVYALYTFRKATIKKGKSVLLLGKGFFSKVVQELSIEAGADVITVANENGHVSKKNRSRGTLHSFNWYDIEGLKDTVKKLTNGKGCDTVIDFTGSEFSKAIAEELLNEKGSLVLTRKPGSDNGKSHNTIILYEEENIKKADNVKAMLKDPLIDKIDHASFISHKVHFNEIEKAFDILCENPEGYIKCVIIFD